MSRLRARWTSWNWPPLLLCRQHGRGHLNWTCHKPTEWVSMSRFVRVRGGLWSKGSPRPMRPFDQSKLRCPQPSVIPPWLCVQAPRASHYISPLLSCNYASRRMGVTSIPEPGADIAYHIQPDNLLLQAATALMVMPGTYANARISPHGGKASDFVYRCVQMHACKITTSMSVSISSERMLRVTS